MKRLGLNLFAAGLLVVALNTRAAETNDAPEFKEVYNLIRSHLTGISDADLNRAAVEGLFTTLRGKVSLVGSAKTPQRANGELISKSTVLDDDIAYLRVSRVDDGLAKEISRAHEQLSATNKVKGLALDLRFAEGEDYAAAAAAADLFIAKERALLDWGNGMVKSKEKKDSLSVPVAVLINRDTVGSAEALAATLRETGTALILGNTTAGGAMMAKEFSLNNGQKLRIATSPVKLGDGTALTAQGVKPDIEVPVSLADERAYFADAYGLLTKTLAAGGLGQTDGTNRAVRRPRITEADLVRGRNDGKGFDVDTPLARDSEQEKPVIRDPALARAVDLLKGLAVVRRGRS